jgi:hypothetical protein
MIDLAFKPAKWKITKQNSREQKDGNRSEPIYFVHIESHRWEEVGRRMAAAIAIVQRSRGRTTPPMHRLTNGEARLRQCREMELGVPPEWIGIRY